MNPTRFMFVCSVLAFLAPHYSEAADGISFTPEEITDQMGLLWSKELDVSRALEVMEDKSWVAQHDGRWSCSFLGLQEQRENDPKSVDGVAIIRINPMRFGYAPESDLKRMTEWMRLHPQHDRYDFEVVDGDEVLMSHTGLDRDDVVAAVRAYQHEAVARKSEWPE